MDGHLLFTANYPHSGRQLWISDGTEAGTTLLTDPIRADDFIGIGSGPANFHAVQDGRAIFTINDGTHGSELWVTDGTADGTRLLADIHPGATGSNPREFFRLDDERVLFGADHPEYNYELWITDGTEAGTGLVSNHFPAGSGGPRAGTVLTPGTALYAAYTEGAGNELTRTDGASTMLVKDVAPGTRSSGMDNFVQIVEGRVLFTASNAGWDTPVAEINGNELWITDGTEAATRMVRDIQPGPRGSFPAHLTPLGDGRALFAADDGTHGQELWITDGTEAGTRLVRDIWPGSEGSWLRDFHSLGDGRALLAANDGVHGSELWITDGTQAGTTMLGDLRTGPNSSGPRDFATLGNGEVVFTADGFSGAFWFGRAIWITDGTAEGTRMLTDAVRPDDTPRFTPLGDGRVAFAGSGPGPTGTTASEPWVTDGTAEGTHVLKDIIPGTGSSSPRDFALIDFSVERIGADDDEVLVGGIGNDVFLGLGGDDTLDGGPGGINTAYFRGEATDYLVETDPVTGVTTVTDLRDPATTPDHDGTDRLINIQILRFADPDAPVPPPAVHQVTVALSDLDGQALGNASVSFQPAAIGNPAEQPSDAAGLCIFDLATGASGRFDASRAWQAGDPAITALDALDVLRMAVGLTPSFGPAQAQNYIAADINRDGAVTALDALDVLRAAVGLTSAHAPQWVFFDTATDWAGLGLSAANTQVETGINIPPLAGDLDIAMTGILLGNMAEVS